MYHADKVYLDSVREIFDRGVFKEDRTGVGTLSVFGQQQRYDLTKGFPLLTSKKLYTRGIVGELLFFLRGETNVNWLTERSIHIWDEWRRPYTLDREVSTLSLIKDDYRRRKSLYQAPEDAPHVVDTSNDGRLSELHRRLLSDGVEMCPEWRNSVDSFVKDVKRLPHYWYSIGRDDVVLDTTYLGETVFSPDNCVWISREEQELYERCEAYRLFDDKGSERTVLVKGAVTVPSGFVFSPLVSDNYRLALIEDGDLGPIYGAQWRNFSGASELMFDTASQQFVASPSDQILTLLTGLRDDPFSRRHMLAAWNPLDVDQMALPPCHTFAQFYVTPDKDGRPHGLSCQLYQRSRDSGLGQPYNIASYALLTHLFADLVGLVPLEFVHTTGDVHIYLNHVDALKEQLSRYDRLPPMPHLEIRHPASVNIEDPELFHRYSVDNFVFNGYDPLCKIQMNVAV